ncbi:hypothetical protein CEXT_533301 [Caerostris extrusa]|uniref:Uncharacterized protein n=1 Tax=Caerostris extrusa TaxID=172846 RepID=A0AAV4PP58_CAEEX|nr:hypothetical protein CEXT_533301 [Caerostris extrusa]
MRQNKKRRRLNWFFPMSCHSVKSIEIFEEVLKHFKCPVCDLSVCGVPLCTEDAECTKYALRRPLGVRDDVWRIIVLCIHGYEDERFFDAFSQGK